jgi:hypothetical protein
MKTIKLKNLYISILICVLVVNAIVISLVHAAQTIPGVQRLQEGIVAYEHGEYEDALFKLEMAKIQISEVDKDSLWSVHFYSGLSYYLIGDNDEAKKAFIKAQGITKNKLPDQDIHSPKIVRLFKETKINNKQEVIIPSRIKLRSSYSELSIFQVQSIPNISIRHKYGNGFYGHSTIIHRYEKKSINGDTVVIDYATGLIWHQNGSDENMKWKKVKKWVTRLNKKGYAGYKDWRLPTVEEAASLLESNKGDVWNDLYIAPLFSNVQWWIWTGDKKKDSETTWRVDFRNGDVYWSSIYDNHCVRPVRTGIP